jgi:putative Mg2+ transporter-C (MgtC) family protein
MIGVTSGDVTLVLRALLAAALGFAVGWEREAHGHAAGVRTISIVTLAAAALTTLAVISFGTPDRIIANIIVSVGFLGAGMILRGQQGEARGLTTAASVWGMTIVGMVVGLGHYLTGVTLTAIILLLLWCQYIPWLARLLPPPAPRAPSPPHTHASELRNHAQPPAGVDVGDDNVHDAPDTHETPPRRRHAPSDADANAINTRRPA